MNTSKKARRNYKDTVSRMLFRKPENALSLYNALNGTNYTDSAQITFNMLENAIYMGMHNDISFLITLEEAVEQAIEYCIKNDILKEFLTEQKAEVVKMSIFEYDEQREIELIRRDEREIGKEIGEKIGMEKERWNTEKERENTIQSIISFGRKLGGSKEQIVKELQERCGLSEKQAGEKMRQYMEN